MCGRGGQWENNNNNNKKVKGTSIKLSTIKMHLKKKDARKVKGYKTFNS